MCLAICTWWRVLGSQHSKCPFGCHKLESVQNSIVFGIRCFGIVHTTKHDFLDFPRPGIRFFGRLDRAFLGKISAPRQLGQSRAGPAREIWKIRVLSRPGRAPSVWVFMVWLPKSSGFLRLLLQTDAKSWKSIGFLGKSTGIC